jgi:hypothetical protein
MTGHSEPLQTVRWSDAYLLDVSVEYERVRLSLRESGGSTVEVSAWGHIGVSLVGFWDETVIEAADLVTAHPFAESCMIAIADRYGNELPETGSPERNAGEFATLVVGLSDGATLLVAASRFDVLRPSRG